ncbi:hypothetical protein AND_000896 [Anopheles darlingi]|uniref:Uncharacterized protein n=1 Tax=Anopheles darlingi TaxID=43151 RepID=W5JVE4_ANODA|nr:hypothetical protein AND_000896 [Anopheles darlingi]
MRNDIVLRAIDHRDAACVASPMSDTAMLPPPGNTQQQQQQQTAGWLANSLPLGRSSYRVLLRSQADRPMPPGSLFAGDSHSSPPPSPATSQTGRPNFMRDDSLAIFQTSNGQRDGDRDANSNTADDARIRSPAWKFGTGGVVPFRSLLRSSRARATEASKDPPRRAEHCRVLSDRLTTAVDSRAAGRPAFVIPRTTLPKNITEGYIPAGGGIEDPGVQEAPPGLATTGQQQQQHQQQQQQLTHQQHQHLQQQFQKQKLKHSQHQQQLQQLQQQHHHQQQQHQQQQQQHQQSLGTIPAAGSVVTNSLSNGIGPGGGGGGGGGGGVGNGGTAGGGILTNGGGVGVKSVLGGLISGIPQHTSVPVSSSSSSSLSPVASSGSHIPPRYQPPPHPPGGILKNGYTNGHLRAYHSPRQHQQQQQQQHQQDLGQNGHNGPVVTFSNTKQSYGGATAAADLNLKRPPNPSRLLAPRQHIRFSNLPPLVNGGQGTSVTTATNSTVTTAVTTNGSQQQQQQHINNRQPSESSSEDQTTSSTRSLQAHLAHAKPPAPSAAHIHQTTAIVHHNANGIAVGSSSSSSSSGGSGGSGGGGGHPTQPPISTVTSASLVNGPGAPPSSSQLTIKPAQPPSSNLPTAIGNGNHLHLHHQHHQQQQHPVQVHQHPAIQQHQQEMLKFVRKAESETSSTPTSSTGGGGGGGGGSSSSGGGAGGRVTALDQNRHFQNVHTTNGQQEKEERRSWIVVVVSSWWLSFRIEMGSTLSNLVVASWLALGVGAPAAGKPNSIYRFLGSDSPAGLQPEKVFGVRCSNLLAELRALKEANQRLSDDNQELRDLCCFLDDDRQKGRKLAREWQRFGRYTASVMRQEVSAYQTKLRQLDDKQQELIRDNLELKELCLYLDEERNNNSNTAAAASAVCSNCGTTNANAVAALRDDGDGSSSSTNADENLHNIGQFGRNGMTDLNMRSTLSDQTLQYVRALESRIRQLEEERAVVLNNTAVATTNGGNATTGSGGGGASQLTSGADPISGRPEAVVRALQVLEVREQLERERIGTTPPDQLDDGEKALVREMCNVVWRKLEEAPNTGIDQHV